MFRDREELSGSGSGEVEREGVHIVGSVSHGGKWLNGNVWLGLESAGQGRAGKGRVGRDSA